MLRLQRPLPDLYTHAPASELAERVAAAKAALGPRLVVLGHHYQRDDVIAFADATGDSLGLSRFAASQREAEYVVFCGVHFMAEAADVLTSPDQLVVLPDLNAGCSMADMADDDDVAVAWEELGQVIDLADVVPVTYMNSSAALKAFVGDAGGSVCTSSNAPAVLRWALGLEDDERGERRPDRPSSPRGSKVLFFPDQHLGRNTGYRLGFDAADMAVWDPRRPLGGNDPETLEKATLLLWRGHCSVHQRFRPEHVAAFRAEHPDGVVAVHPECAHEVVELADYVGSTDYLIATVASLPPGTVVAVGTEIHLVNRLAARHPDRTVLSLDPLVCPCSTMSRIDLPHLAWVLDGLLEGEVRNRIVVDPVTAARARVALERMLAIV
jgi:quinolinate synthase